MTNEELVARIQNRTNAAECMAQLWQQNRAGDSGLRVSVLAGTFRSGCCPLFFLEKTLFRNWLICPKVL